MNSTKFKNNENIEQIIFTCLLLKMLFRRNLSIKLPKGSIIKSREWCIEHKCQISFSCSTRKILLNVRTEIYILGQKAQDKFFQSRIKPQSYA